MNTKCSDIWSEREADVHLQTCTCMLTCRLSPAERTFVCRMLTSKAFRLQRGGCCSMLVTGSFQPLHQLPSFSSSPRLTHQPLFIALCTPTVDRLQADDPHLCHSFSSVHRLDLSCTQVSHRLGHMST